ncbi:hypothetical protein H6A08_08765 [Enorma massiliensis]|uniref:hypothetical protein n=1 Tax=Enorma massiliensis TaxID=1472761 RepID=UPI00195BA818|nr:hypothetical protein [Enorma massiliensis]MBM6784441.1 hypothetical protein [Enorma massiliensis]
MAKLEHAEMPAEVAVAGAIDLVTALRDVCGLVDPELATECRRSLGALWALAARVEASESKRLPAMMAVRVRPSNAHLALSDLMREPRVTAAAIDPELIACREA